SGTRAPDRSSRSETPVPAEAAPVRDPRGELSREGPDRMPHFPQLGRGGAEEVDVFDRRVGHVGGRREPLDLEKAMADLVGEQSAELFDPVALLVPKQAVVEAGCVVTSLSRSLDQRLEAIGQL